MLNIKFYFSKSIWCHRKCFKLNVSTLSISCTNSKVSIMLNRSGSGMGDSVQAWLLFFGVRRKAFAQSYYLKVFHVCNRIHHSQYGEVRDIQWRAVSVSEPHIFPRPSAVTCTSQQEGPSSTMFTEFTKCLHLTATRLDGVDTIFKDEKSNVKIQ